MLRRRLSLPTVVVVCHRFGVARFESSTVTISPVVDKHLNFETRCALLRIAPEPQQEYLVEIAGQSAAACRFCGLTIPSGHLRIGAVVHSGSGDFTFPSWTHLECFETGYRRCFPDAMTDWSKVSGVSSISEEHADRLAKLVFGPGSRIRPDDAKRLKLQSSALREADAILTELHKSVMAQHMQTVFGPSNAESLMKQGTKATPRAYLNAVLADALLFGVPEPCPTCGGVLKEKNNRYECTGHIDEYTRCTHSQPTISRQQVTPQLRDLGAKLKITMLSEPRMLQPRVDAPKSHRSSSTGANDKEIALFDGIHVIGFTDKFIKTLPGAVKVGQRCHADSLIPHMCRLNNNETTLKNQFDLSPRVTQKWFECCLQVGTTVLTPTSFEEFVRCGPKKNPTEDLQKYMDLLKAQAAEATGNQAPKTKKVVVHGATAVDAEVPDAEQYTVVSDNKGQPYTAFLTKTDLATGRNSMYVLQLLRHRGRGTMFLYRRWGRVGELIGSSKIEEGNTRDFEKIFMERTGNTWGEPFVKKPGLMAMVAVDYSVSSKTSSTTTAGGGASSSSGSGSGGPQIILHKKTRELMELLFDDAVITESMQSMLIDTDKLPLGSLSLETLHRGEALLQDIAKLVQKTKKMSAADRGKLLSLTNRYYSCVPQRIELSQREEAIIDTPSKIAKQSELLLDLKDIVTTKTLMQESQNTSDKAVTNYQSLKTDFVYLDPSTKDYPLVKEYFKTTQGSTHQSYHMHDLWRIDRAGEEKRFAKWSKDDNRKLLWHGSRLTNWPAILVQGLRIAPPEAPVTGYMFGKGVYFADMMSKSANYCHVGYNSKGLMALAEVALGRPHVLTSSDSSMSLSNLPKGSRSVFAVGRNGPAKFKDPFKSGVQVPSYKDGDCSDTKSRYLSLVYNEYIVYDVTQIRLRYLLAVSS